MERDPPRLIREDESRGDHELREVVWKYANLLVPLEIDARLLKEVYRFRREHVFAGLALVAVSPDEKGGAPESPRLKEEKGYALCAKMKIELPCRHVLWVVAVLVGKCKSDLNDLEEIHVTAHCLVVVVRGGLESANWTRDRKSVV